MNAACPFCKIIDADEANRIVLQNRYAIAIRDGYPITPGHTLIIPKRHIKKMGSEHSFL